MPSSRPSGRRVAAERRGREGEWLAERHLAGLGWEVLARRVRTPLGEVDLIARDGDAVVFVEVKWRKAASALADAIDSARLARVTAAAELLAADYCRAEDALRIDVLLLAPRAEPRHIINASMG